MAASPRFKVFDGEEYIACFKDHLEAIRYIQALGHEGQTARVGHSKKDIFWSFTAEDVNWDDADQIGADRIAELEASWPCNQRAA